VLFARPLTDADRPATPLWLDTVVVKLADVDTRTLYDVAPVAVPQLKVNEVSWFVAPFVGETRATVGGSVVKFQAFDHGPVQQAVKTPSTRQL
jgi:hypothetical protein